MGDLLHGSSLASVRRAASMYAAAATASSPQGMFNLAVLALQGHVLPPSVHALFNASHRDERDDIVVKILERCVQTEKEDALTACSLTLLAVRMVKALRRMSENAAQLLLTWATLLFAVVVVVVVPLQNHLERRVYGRGESSIDSSGERDGVRRLRQTCDVAVSVAGVCLCAFWTTLLCHLL